MTPEQFSQAYVRVLPGVSEPQLARQRNQLLQTVRAQHARYHPVPVRVWALAGTAFLACLFIAWRVFAPQQLVASVASQQLEVGGAITTDQQPAAIRFSDGSRIDVASEGSVQITELTGENAKVKLERGRVEASIRKHTGVAWRIDAGPYRVEVVGTQFSVDWNADDAKIDVRVTEGIVKVSGGTTPSSGIFLRAGESFAPAGGREVEAAGRGQKDGLPESSSLALAGQEPVTTSDGASGMAPSAKLGSGSEQQAVAEQVAPDWRQLARQGAYQRALAVARAAGPSLVQQLDAADSLLLGNTARLAGDQALASRAYHSIRSRFAGQREATVAAFSLGRLAADSGGSKADAARWFEIFLRESPRGDLAAGARARLMSAYLGMGERIKAEAVARDYLRYHPTGPHAETAESLVKEKNDAPRSP